MSEDQEKKHYEISFLVKSDEEVPIVLRLVGQHGAEVQGEPKAGATNLAYEINKLSRAIFCFLTVRALPENIKLLEKDLAALPSILRFLVIKLPRESFGTRRGLSEYHRARKPPTARKSSTPPAPKQQEVLSNEAIEKKIEEILQ